MKYQLVATRAEIRKMTLFRGTWIMLAVTVIVPAAVVTALGINGNWELSDSRIATICEYPMIVVGVLWGALEWRDKSWTSTLSSNPRRLSVLATKSVAVIAAGIVVSLLSALTVGIVGSFVVPSVVHRQQDFNKLHPGAFPDVPTVGKLWNQAVHQYPGLMVATVLIGLVWAGIGFLIRFQALGAAVAVIYSVGIAHVLASNFRFARWDPIWAFQGLAPATNTLSFSSLSPVAEIHGVPMSTPPIDGWEALVDFAVSICLVSFFASLLIRRADIT